MRGEAVAAQGRSWSRRREGVELRRAARAVDRLDEGRLGPTVARPPRARPPVAWHRMVPRPLSAQPIPANPTPKRLLTPDEAARALGIGRTKLYELLANGRIRSIHIVGSRRVSTDALRSLVRGLDSAANWTQAG